MLLVGLLVVELHHGETVLVEFCLEQLQLLFLTLQVQLFVVGLGQVDLLLGSMKQNFIRDLKRVFPAIE